MNVSLIVLLFLVPPQIVPFSFGDTACHANQFIQASCTVSEGDLPLNITWMFNNEELDLYPEITVAAVGRRISVLSIESVTYSHAGNYTCKARNLAGEVSYTAELLVNGAFISYASY